MSELIAWLRAQLDDDERKVAAMAREAERARTAPIFQGYPTNWLAGVDIFVSPKRWQAEVDAKRQLLELHRPAGTHDGMTFCTTCGSGEPYEYPTDWPCLTLRLRAEPHAGRGGWQEEWAA